MIIFSSPHIRSRERETRFAQTCTVQSHKDEFHIHVASDSCSVRSKRDMRPASPPTPRVVPFAPTIRVHASARSFSLTDVDLFYLLIIAIADVTARDSHCEPCISRRPRVHSRYTPYEEFHPAFCLWIAREWPAHRSPLHKQPLSLPTRAILAGTNAFRDGISKATSKLTLRVFMPD